MNDILHVPNIYTNLLSVHQFTKDNDCCFIFDSSSFIIQDRKSGKTLFHSLTSNGLYPFHSSVPPLHSTAFFGAKVSADVWHRRLGHPSSTFLHKVLSNSKLSLGSLSIVNSFCEYCQYAKGCKLPFSLSETVTTQPLDLIHSDVWGPAPTSSICGFKFYVLFIDDFSKYTWMFPLMSKSDVWYISYI